MKGDYSHWEPSRTNAPCARGTRALKFRRICGSAGELVVRTFVGLVQIGLFHAVYSSLRQNGRQAPSLTLHQPPRSDGTHWRLSSRSFPPPGSPLPITHPNLGAFGSGGSQ